MRGGMALGDYDCKTVRHKSCSSAVFTAFSGLPHDRTHDARRIGLVLSPARRLDRVARISTRMMGSNRARVEPPKKMSVAFPRSYATHTAGPFSS